MRVVSPITSYIVAPLFRSKVEDLLGEFGNIDKPYVLSVGRYRREGVDISVPIRNWAKWEASVVRIFQYLPPSIVSVNVALLVVPAVVIRVTTKLVYQDNRFPLPPLVRRAAQLRLPI